MPVFSCLRSDLALRTFLFHDLLERGERNRAFHDLAVHERAWRTGDTCCTALLRLCGDFGGGFAFVQTVVELGSVEPELFGRVLPLLDGDRKSTRLNSSHMS